MTDEPNEEEDPVELPWSAADVVARREPQSHGDQQPELYVEEVFAISLNPPIRRAIVCCAECRSQIGAFNFNDGRWWWTAAGETRDVFLKESALLRPCGNAHLRSIDLLDVAQAIQASATEIRV